MKKCGCLFDYVSNHNIKELKNMTKQELIERVEIIIQAHRNNKYVSTTDLMVMIIKVMEGNKKC